MLQLCLNKVLQKKILLSFFEFYLGTYGINQNAKYSFDSPDQEPSKKDFSIIES